ncbi:MAG: hypothetical protein ABFR53_06690 [Actinomycetota bacterium]
MSSFHTPRRAVAILAIAVALVASACDSGSSTPPTVDSSGSSVTSQPTTTVAPLTSLPEDAIPGTNSPSISPEIAAEMRQDIGVLILEAEEARGLPFLSVPTITILDQSAFTERVNADLKADLAEEDLTTDEALLKLLGMLEPDDDLESMIIDLYTEQIAGFYDTEAKELVVPVAADGITPLQSVTIVHELVHALTDQHFDFNDEYERRIDEGNGDDASAALALIEGDATYQQFLFLESMSPEDAADAALEVLSFDSVVFDSMPAWLQRDLGFPYEKGLTFVGQIMSTAGLKGVDDAYKALPITTEQILDPNKYLRNEQPESTPPLTVDLPGWEMAEEATFGEWGIQLLLTDAAPPGAVTQAAAGWGGDTYRFFTQGAESAIAWSYQGETETDAEDLTDALISHITDVMGATNGRESLGGLLYDGASPFVFIDRIDAAVVFIAATDLGALESLRAQLGV